MERNIYTYKPFLVKSLNVRRDLSTLTYACLANTYTHNTYTRAPVRAHATHGTRVY